MTSSATPSQRGIGAGPATPEGPDPRHDYALAPSAPPTRDFDAFFIETFPVLVKHLIRYGGELGEAEEAAQTAMIDICRRWGHIDRPEAYAFKAAQRALIHERMRTRSLIPKLIASAALENRTGLEPEAAATDQQDAGWVVEILEALPRRQREVLALLVDGFTTSEVAEHLNVTDTAVRSNLYKARRTLAKRWRTRGNALADPDQEAVT